MKVLRCDIHNFRSIKEMSIKFDKMLKIFIGYNEAGKSNIIKALSLLNINTEVSKDDVRDSYSDIEYEDSAYVQFIFEFDESEIVELNNILLRKIFLINENENDLLLKFCKNNNQLIYKIDLKNQNRFYQYWTINEKNHPLFKSRIKEVIQPNHEIIMVNDKKFVLKNYNYIFYDEIINVKEDGIKDANFNNIINLYFEVKKEFAINRHPEVISWSYNENKIIPQRINVNSFIENPDSCMALKNMFNLSDIQEINKEITNSKMKKNGFVNLLRRVSNITTEYIHSVWLDQKLIKINLSENGDNIEFAIEDEKNLYELSRRSDGFKRFISFLLSIGAKNKAEKIKDIFLIIDEPDIGLHPSSSRQLMDELINVSKNNFVYYSTHSIFMIYNEDISTHYIVKKENEITRIEEINSTDIIEVEILYNALGYSAFHVLKMNNIIFEGWRDKKLFELCLKFLCDKDDDFKKYNEIGMCHSQGVKDIHRITEILNLANRQYIIISDFDKPAQEARERSNEKNKWLTYNNFENNVITCEDFIILEYNNECFINACKKNSISVKIEENMLPTNIVQQYNDLLKKNNIEKDIQKIILNDYKELLFNKITPDRIRESYFNFIKNVINLD